MSVILIRVRRAGLVSFLVKTMTIFTGLAFVVLVTSDVSTTEFALWNLIASTLVYVLFPTFIINFWATRARARGQLIARTVLVASLIFSAVLTVFFVVVSIPSSGLVAQATTQNSNLFFFLLSSPQVLLYTFVGSMEAMLWGSSPEKQSFGYAAFEVAKIAIGLVAFVVFRLGLEGAILAVMGAQIVQVCTILVFTRKEYSAPLSASTLKMWLKSGWPSALQNLHPMILNLDLVIVAIFIPSSANALVIDYFAASRVIASVVGYAESLSYGLYPSILSGEEPHQRTSHVLELQLMILAPMLVGAIVLSNRLLVLLNPVYVPGAIIVIPLAISYAFYSLRSLLEGVIMGSEKVDLGEKMTLQGYFKSKLFLVSKIDLSTSLGYLASVVIFSVILSNYTTITFFSLNGKVIIGIVWGVANLGRSLVTFLLKAGYAHRIAHLHVPLKTWISITISSVAFGVALWRINLLVVLFGGKILQALELLAVGILGLIVYFVVLLILSETARRLAKSIYEYIF
jgi:hypothetical protein